MTRYCIHYLWINHWPIIFRISSWLVCKTFSIPFSLYDLILFKYDFFTIGLESVIGDLTETSFHKTKRKKRWAFWQTFLSMSWIACPRHAFKLRYGAKHGKVKVIRTWVSTFLYNRNFATLQTIKKLKISL